jgi:SAM-dependent methyltransferase
MVQARYDAVAEFYIEGFNSIDDPASRALLDLLGPVAGLLVLDVACGHGRMTRELARRGASVVGIDVSGALIARARQTEQDERLGIRYLHGDVTLHGSLGGFDGGFDVAACNFGLSDIDDLDAAIAAAGDALKPGGSFALSCIRASRGAGTSRVPGQPPAATTTRGAGRPRASVPAYAGSWALATGRCQPISPRCAARAYGWTSSPSRSRRQTGIRPMMPTVSRSSSWPGVSSFPQPDITQVLRFCA